MKLQMRKESRKNNMNWAVLTFLILPFFMSGQESKLGNWAIYLGNKQLNSKFNLHHEVQYRNYNAVGDLEQLLLRAGLGYNLSENNNNLLIGYGYILSENYIGETNDKVSINEHRIYQQFISKQQFSRISLQHRYRFEQRFVEEDFKLRFRYFLGLNVPLTNKEMIDKTVYFSAYNEVFLNTDADVFDRNRLYGGIGYRLNKTIRFELGYMNQFFANGNRDQVNVISFVNF
jgi:hypothetical protein